MSTYWDTVDGTQGSVGFRASTRIATTIRQCWDAYAERRAHNRAIAHLRYWSDRELKDIGISRGQIEFAVRDTVGCRDLHRRMD